VLATDTDCKGDGYIRRSVMDRWRFYAQYIKMLEVQYNSGSVFTQVFSILGGDTILPSLRILLFELASGISEFPAFASLLSPSVLKIEFIIRVIMKHDDIENYLDIIGERAPNLKSLVVRPYPWFYRRHPGPNISNSPLNQPSNLLLASLSRLSHLELLKIPSCWATDTVLSELGKLPSLYSLDLQDCQSSCHLHPSITSLFTTNASSAPAAKFPSLTSLLLRGNLDRLRHLLKNVFKGCHPVRLSLLADQEDIKLDRVASIPGVEECATLIARRFQQLQALRFECKGKTLYCLDGGDVQKFTVCTSLTVIEFVGIEFDSDDELTPLFQNWPNVRALTLVSLPASITCKDCEEGYEGAYDESEDPSPTGLRDWLADMDLAGLSMGCLSSMAVGLPRLERLIISITAEPAPYLLRPFDLLTYLELRSSFLNYSYDGFSRIAAAKYLGSLLRPECNFVFTMDPSLDELISKRAGLCWHTYVATYMDGFAQFQESVNGYLKVCSEEIAPPIKARGVLGI
jgi:hypothetical protein